MTIATHNIDIEKEQLIKRANILKPNVANVIATDRGWAIVQPRGTIELLVSFPGLDVLLAEVVEGEPVVEVKKVEIEKVEPVVEDKVEEIAKVEDDEEDEPVIVAPAKRGPKPKAK